MYSESTKIIAITAIASLTLLSACQLLQTASEQAAAAVVRYCQAPIVERAQIQIYLDTKLAPNRAKIWCDGDPPD